MPDKQERLTVWFVVKASAGAALTVAALIGTLYGSHEYIRTEIDKRLRDPEVLDAVAARVRPAVIFDSHGSIIADMGAMQRIESLIVRPSTNAPSDKLDAQPPSLIIVTPREHLAQAPLMTMMDPFIALDLDIRRGTGLSWEYEVKQAYHVTTGSKRALYFRLELLH
jgi:hypothetical protein